MSSSTTAALRKPQSLAELLDARPDTREMISANLNLAHACLLLKQGESEEVERALKLAQRTVSPGLASISRCIRAEALRIAGNEDAAWEMAEELANEDRFDVVAALYLRHLFPLRKPASDGGRAAMTIPVKAETPAVEAPATPPAAAPSAWETSLPADSSLPVDSAPSAPVATPQPEASSPLLPVPEPVPAAPAPGPAAEPVDDLSVSEQVSVVQDQDDSEIALPLDEAPQASESVGEFPAALRKVAEDATVMLLRHRSPDGSVAEIVRSHRISEEIEALLVERSAKILDRLGFGKPLHASYEGPQGAAHSWNRGGRTLLLAVHGASSAPALAARCTRAMEELR
jgi:hypothetical protein